MRNRLKQCALDTLRREFMVFYSYWFPLFSGEDTGFSPCCFLSVDSSLPPLSCFASSYLYRDIHVCTHLHRILFSYQHLLQSCIYLLILCPHVWTINNMMTWQGLHLSSTSGTRLFPVIHKVRKHLCKRVPG